MSVVALDDFLTSVVCDGHYGDINKLKQYAGETGFTFPEMDKITNPAHFIRTLLLHQFSWMPSSGINDVIDCVLRVMLLSYYKLNNLTDDAIREIMSSLSKNQTGSLFLSCAHMRQVITTIVNQKTILRLICHLKDTENSLDYISLCDGRYEIEKKEIERPRAFYWYVEDHINNKQLEVHSSIRYHVGHSFRMSRGHDNDQRFDF